MQPKLLGPGMIAHAAVVVAIREAFTELLVAASSCAGCERVTEEPTIIGSRREPHGNGKKETQGPALLWSSIPLRVRLPLRPLFASAYMVGAGRELRLVLTSIFGRGDSAAAAAEVAATLLLCNDLVLGAGPQDRAVAMKDLFDKLLAWVASWIGARQLALALFLAALSALVFHYDARTATLNAVEFAIVLAFWSLVTALAPMVYRRVARWIRWMQRLK